ncbi:hypothetical protein QP868_02225 [Brevibacterium sp. UMB1308A]|uniref:VG15 protein n=1 Tax=Brevibacterium sp. UMB1308A TaxID=3050608 RepID=UPI00254A52F0|nr:hypothetical protein [Brevibacterium sp. UMB1308A]MDK8345439.1 hypothetical protein [Brevibacterium sp. UMB1308B]MDK8712715.1 hypothetical protein [Brevibacterium sp. UMB1308A]
MPTRDDIELLVHARNTLIGKAQRELVAVFSAVERKDPRVVRNVLLEAVPVLVRKYGDGAAAAAADWYLQMRAKDVPGAVDFPIVLGDPVPDGVVRDNVRYAAKFLFGGDPAMTVGALHGAIGRHVKYAEMSTLWQLGVKDTVTVRYALVPRPPMTCSWCSFLSSRGWVYTSEAKGLASQHSNCDCSVVPSWDAEKAHIDGYDPEADHRRYKRARASVPAQGVGETSDEFTARVLRQAREMFPDDYTDGKMRQRREFTSDGSIDLNVWRRKRQDRAREAKRGHYGHEALARRIPPSRPDAVPSSWSDDLPELSAKAWNHILYGFDGRGGHLPGYEWVNGGTPFPVDWTKHDIVEAAEAVLRHPELVVEDDVTGRLTFTRVVNGFKVLVGASKQSTGKMKVLTCFCPQR